MPGAQPHPQSSWAEKENAHKSSGKAEIARHSLRNGFTAAPCSPRCPGSLATIASGSPRFGRMAESRLQSLDSSVGESGSHGLTVRPFLARLARRPAATAACPAFVALMRRPSDWVRMRGVVLLFCPTPEAIYFFRKGWTDRNSLRWQRKLDFGRTPRIPASLHHFPGRGIPPSRKSFAPSASSSVQNVSRSMAGFLIRARSASDRDAF